MKSLVKAKNVVRYLPEALISESFKRLSSRDGKPKAHLERTSAILYFLTLDAASQSLSKEILVLDPKTTEGKNNRRSMELEFRRLILLKAQHDEFTIVKELGKIYKDIDPPEKRISSNFLTVSLKKASTSGELTTYPKRPKFPVLGLGSTATGYKWGLTHHPDWAKNFPHLVSGCRSNTPHLDLAVFCLRDSEFNNDTQDVFMALDQGLNKKYSPQLAKYFSSKIKHERKIARHVTVGLNHTYPKFNTGGFVAEKYTTAYDKMNKRSLIERISYLENILKMQKIKF